MTGERKRQRQQRVRHEAGGSTGTAENSSSSQQSGPPDGGPQSSITPTPHATAPKTASSASVAAKPRGRGGAAGRRGVAVATVDQTHYQPVTIMESKEGAVDELDETPRTKYKRRGIVSNWSRYDERSSFLEEISDGSDYLIGEDYSSVLQQQSQGGGGGGHLFLKGEESWGGSCDEYCSGQFGLGALKVEDLEATLATVSFMDQLGIDAAVLPKQLAEHYQALADDNLRLYDPSSNTKDIVDTAEIIEQQMTKLRLSFFDSSTKQPATIKNRNAKIEDRESDYSNKNITELKGFDNLEDFNLLTDVQTKNDPDKIVKVDLTEKMCKAFGSDINSIGDDFGGLTFNDTTNELEDVDTLPSNSVKSIASDISGNIQSSSLRISNDVRSNTEEPLDFSAGITSFNFGLPKSGPPLSNLSSVTCNSQDDSSAATPFVAAVADDVYDFLSSSHDASKVPASVPEHPIIDLNAPIIPKPVALVTSVDETKELEDWLDSVLDD